MRKWLIALAALFCFAGGVRAQQFTQVTATITDSAGTPYISGTYSVSLVNTTGQQPLLGGNANFQQNFNGALTSAGFFSVSLPSVTQLFPLGMQWTFNICANPQVVAFQFPTLTVPCFSYTSTGTQISGTSIDLSSSMTPVATVIPKTPTTTGNNVFTGSLSVSGATTVKSFSNMQFISAPANATASDQGWAGTDPCAWHAAAFAALPATGGFVDGRGLNGTGYNACAASFTVGGLNTKPEEFDLASVAIFVPSTVTLNGGSQLRGLGSNSNGPFPTRIIAKTGTFPNNSTLIQFDSTQVNQSIQLKDMEIDCAGITGCTAIDMGEAQEGARLQNLWVANWMTAGVRANTSPTENWTADQIVLCGAAAAPSTAIGMILYGTGDHFNILNLSSCSVPSSPIAAVVQCNGCSAGVTTLHAEDATDGWQAASGSGTNGGTSHIQQINCLSNITNCVHIKSGFTGTLFVGAINTLNAGSPVSFLIDAGVVGASAITCTDKAVGDFYIDTQAAQPIFRSSCATGTNLVNYINNTSTVVVAGTGAKFSDLTASHNHTYASGINVCGTDLMGIWDYTTSKCSINTNTNSPFTTSAPGPIVPSTAGAADVGSTAQPWGNLWLGTAATNNFKFAPAATAAARTISIPDPLGNTSLPLTIVSGTKALNTASVTTATCDAGVAATATGALSTDTVDWSFNSAPTTANKYGAFLVVYAVPSANTVTFYTCNPSATTSTPTAMTVNWSVRRP